MLILGNTQCPICGSRLGKRVEMDEDCNYRIVCPTCGRFAMQREYYDDYIAFQNGITRDEIAPFLYYHKNKSKYLFLCRENIVVPDIYRSATMSEIKNWQPLKFSEKIDTFLLGVAERQTFMGEVIRFEGNEIDSACFAIKNAPKYADKSERVATIQRDYLLKYLEQEEYIEVVENGVVLLPKGQQRIDELQRKTQSWTKNVFVAMSFNDNTKQTRETLRKAIVDAEFSPEFIDEIIHNKQIVPEMFRLIRECRFLILEISDPNYGAYYEAGYAQGLGKEVIICCSREVFNKKYDGDEEKYAKYLRPHFDIAQKQILVWDDYEDLQKKLAEWIRALFG